MKHSIDLRNFNTLIAGEMIAINQYVVHAEMCDRGGYSDLYKATLLRLAQKIQHTDNLVERILFIESINETGSSDKLSEVSANLEWFEHNLRGEIESVTKHRSAVRQCAEAEDNGIKISVKCILSDEHIHLNWLKTQLTMFSQQEKKSVLTSQIA